MVVAKGEPIQILYNYVKELSKSIPIYKNIMNEDENSIPDSYLLLRADVTNVTNVYGNGKSKIRNSDCDMILISKGTTTSSSTLHARNIKKIKDLLNSKDIDYSCYDLGYDYNSKNSTFTFSTTVIYYGN